MPHDQIIVVGSGLAAVAAARAIAAHDLPVALIEEPEPTSAGPHPDPEHYSAWWPGIDDSVARFATRGIDLLEQLHAESDAGFSINRRGHLFVARRAEVAAALRLTAGRLAASTGGPLREHSVPDWYLPSPARGIRGVPDGIDLIEGHALAALFPFLSSDVKLGQHVRRAGWFDARAARRWLRGAVAEAGGSISSDTIVGIRCEGPERWTVTTSSRRAFPGRALVIVTGRPGSLLRMASIPAIKGDALKIVARLGNGGRLLPDPAPAVVGVDPEDPAEAGPSGLAMGPLARPTPDGALIVESVVPAADRRRDPLAPLGEITLRRLAGYLAAAGTHRGHPSNLTAVLGAVATAADHRPIIGLADPKGCYLVTALPGGATGALAAAELIANALVGTSLPGYGPSLAPARLAPGIASFEAPSMTLNR